MTSSRVLNLNVGVLGHVDAGKTSLVRAMSQVVAGSVTSTAALDKSPQSQERGITLDLGFSAFTAPLPAQFASSDLVQDYDTLQVTLVDCPGHASLIKTIIGGASIIDTMLLVVDVTKGMQTQTAEGLVIGEITSKALVVVLNKADMLPAATREAQLDKLRKRMAAVLSRTKFGGDVPMVVVSAAPRSHDTDAAQSPNGSTDGAAAATAMLPPVGVQTLVDTLLATAPVPERTVRETDPLLFSIDHCFAIRGQGTVLTGTVLAGALAVGDQIEIAELKVTRRVKSMQMFRRSVPSARKGDRVGVCITDFDAKLLERGLACTPGYVRRYDMALVSVAKIPYFRQTIKTGMRFHFTVGHSTSIATAVFFGAAASPDATGGGGGGGGDGSSGHDGAEAATAPSVVSDADLSRMPELDIDYPYQDGLVDPCPLQYALLTFEAPVYAAPGSAVIAGRLDGDQFVNRCRLAFHGRILAPWTPEEMSRLRLYKEREKTGVIDRIVDDNTLIARGLFNKDDDVDRYTGMRVVRTNGEIGMIQGRFGKGDKFKVIFHDGIKEASRAGKLVFRFRRYVHDPTKRMFQPPLPPAT